MEALPRALQEANATDSHATNPLTDPKNPKLGGNPFEEVNKAALLLLIIVPAIPLVVGLVELGICKRSSRLNRCYYDKGHPPMWALVLFVLSYGLLIPGLAGPLFSFNILANVPTIMKIGLGPDGGLDKADPTTESMIGLMSLLHKTGSNLGVLLVLTYAVLIPVAKVILLVAGELLRGRSVRKSLRCVQVVQNISKWACPDMFAYVLLMYLIRGLNHPVLLRAAGQLDLGFTCFSLFCIGSTVAAMGIKAQDKEKRCWKWLAAAVGRIGVLALVVPLAVGFGVLMGYGMQNPIMALRVNLDALSSENGGPIDSDMMEIVNMLDIPSLCKADVSVIRSMQKLLEWMRYGEINSYIGFVLLAVFAVSFTILDMAVLLVSAVCLFFGAGRKYSPLRLNWILKKLSMLDVTIMGVVVVTLCMAMYRDKGVRVTMGGGLLQLTGAEVIHYFCYYLVKGGMQYFEPESNFAEKSMSDLSSESSDDNGDNNEDNNEDSNESESPSSDDAA